MGPDLIKPRAAYFLDKAAKLGCDEWRGPAVVKDAAAHIAALETELALVDEALARYANDEDACLEGDGEPFGSITTECGMKAREARRRFLAREATA
ncbi:hypothetical protein MARCHEWKA_02360 [Brevundimonas phage vB_BpoS-Marchewka]|uniref:Uncharacterized protein n=1 Tax=Brevundimonas phage vB_BpoS-Marchewka TaxID=2948604 RepID=A0A9E7N2V2_9CAUD|nr:hypothetical protein MARCHEWKA_02360 [Brevundimonas phage vB_BpoS-Marchewka]